jgi:hypothetical protein
MILGFGAGWSYRGDLPTIAGLSAGANKCEDRPMVAGCVGSPGLRASAGRAEEVMRRTDPAGRAPWCRARQEELS